MRTTTFHDPPALDTRVQFTVRSLLVGTTLVAVGAALVAPWFHQWTAEQRGAFLRTWCDLVGGAGVAIAVVLVQRVRAERRAGPARYRLSRSKPWRPVVMAVFWSTFLIGYSFLRVSVSGDVAAAGGWWQDLVGVQYGAMFGLSALGIWWRSDCLELRDAGLLRGSSFIPWKTLRSFRWANIDPYVLVLQGQGSITTCRVGREDKAGVDQFLTNRVGDGSASIPSATP